MNMFAHFVTTSNRMQHYKVSVAEWTCSHILSQRPIKCNITKSVW